MCHKLKETKNLKLAVYQLAGVSLTLAITGLTTESTPCNQNRLQIAIEMVPILLALVVLAIPVGFKAILVVSLLIGQLAGQTCNRHLSFLTGDNTEMSISFILLCFIGIFALVIRECAGDWQKENSGKQVFVYICMHD